MKNLTSSIKMSLIALGAIAVLTASNLPSRAAELIMIEQDYCSWCERWHEEIGVVYPKTKEGKALPLRTIDMHDPLPKDLEELNLGNFTPTFVLWHEGKEVARMRGYAGEDFFWGLLSEMIKKLPESEQAPSG